jgi:hypothetical protein
MNHTSKIVFPALLAVHGDSLCSCKDKTLEKPNMDIGAAALSLKIGNFDIIFS